MKTNTVETVETVKASPKKPATRKVTGKVKPATTAKDYGLKTQGAIAFHEAVLADANLTTWVRHNWANNKPELLSTWGDLFEANNDSKDKAAFKPDLAKFRTILRRVTMESEQGKNYQIEMDDSGGYRFYEAATRNRVSKAKPDTTTKSVSFKAKSGGKVRTLSEAREELASFLSGMDSDQVIDQITALLVDAGIKGVKAVKSSK